MTSLEKERVEKMGETKEEKKREEDMGNTPVSEELFEETAERAVVNAVLTAAGPTRRQLLVGLGAATLTALISEVLPLEKLKALAADPVGKPEKKDVSIGFIPITCGTPIIMAEPL